MVVVRFLASGAGATGRRTVQVTQKSHVCSRVPVYGTECEKVTWVIPALPVKRAVRTTAIRRQQQHWFTMLVTQACTQSMFQEPRIWELSKHPRLLSLRTRRPNALFHVCITQ